jgi:hypothetical protein
MNNSPSSSGDSNRQSDPLLSKFSYMFPLGESERRRAYVFFEGWMPLFSALCGNIDAALGRDKREFAWTKIREKFGAPSLCYEMRERARHAIHVHRPDYVRRLPCAPKETFDQVAVVIQELVLETELKLRNRCIVCGADSTITNAHGPWASLCPDHLAPLPLATENSTPVTVWSIARL